MAWLFTFALPSESLADSHVSERITQDTIWSLAESPFIVTADITVDSNATLTIEPGTTVRFQPGKSLKIGSSTASPGGILAQGTSSQPIVFTSNQVSPTPGNWNQIYISSWLKASSIISHATIEYGGSSGSQLYVHSSNLALHDNLIRMSFGAGLSVSGNGKPDLRDNTFQYNNSYPVIILGASNIETLAQANTYLNNAYNKIAWNGGNFSADATIPNPGIPIYLYGNVTVSGSYSPVLTVSPGATLEILAGKSIQAGASAIAPGTLKAEGSATHKITFTASANPPSPGGWNGIKLLAGSDASSLEHVTIEYATTNLTITTSNPTLDSSVLRHASSRAIDITDSSPQLSCNTISDNPVGILFTGTTGNPIISGNNFDGNQNYGLQNNSPDHTLQAENNFWGAANGPSGVASGSGDGVTNGINYANFLPATSACTQPLAAAFTVTPSAGCEELSVQFTDTSSGVIALWDWDFNSDGFTDSTEQNPTHVFSEPGTYSVTLVVTDRDNMTSSSYFADAFTVSPYLTFKQKTRVVSTCYAPKKCRMALQTLFLAIYGHFLYASRGG